MPRAFIGSGGGGGWGDGDGGRGGEWLGVRRECWTFTGVAYGTRTSNMNIGRKEKEKRATERAVSLSTAGMESGCCTRHSSHSTTVTTNCYYVLHIACSRIYDARPASSGRGNPLGGESCSGERMPGGGADALAHARRRSEEDNRQ